MKIFLLVALVALCNMFTLFRRDPSLQEEGGELLSLHLDQSDYNDHEVMANLTAVINHMVNAEILVLHKGVRKSILYGELYRYGTVVRLSRKSVHTNQSFVKKDIYCCFKNHYHLC